MATAAENWLLWLRGARVHRRNCVRDCGVYTAPNTEREHSDRRGALRDEITVPIPSSRSCRFNNQRWSILSCGETGWRTSCRGEDRSLHKLLNCDRAWRACIRPVALQRNTVPTRL
jgi:hypothetical protein